MTIDWNNLTPKERKAKMAQIKNQVKRCNEIVRRVNEEENRPATDQPSWEEIVEFLKGDRTP